MNYQHWYEKLYTSIPTEVYFPLNIDVFMCDFITTHLALVMLNKIMPTVTGIDPDNQ